MKVRSLFLALGLAMLVSACVAPAPGGPTEASLNDRFSGPFAGTVETTLSEEPACELGRVDIDVTITSILGSAQIVGLDGCLNVESPGGFTVRGPFTLTLPKGATLHGELVVHLFTGPTSPYGIDGTFDVQDGTGTYCNARGPLVLDGISTPVTDVPYPPLVNEWDGTATADLRRDPSVACTKK
jgi:hypothetical protein